MKKINLIKNMHYKTQLLEGLNWDEEKLQSLYEYLDSVFNDDVINHPELILKEVEEKFSIEIKNIIKQLFEQVIFENNLHLKGGDIEH